MIVLDTDHISVIQSRDSPYAAALQTRLEAFPLGEVATTAITLEEQMRGWLGIINRYSDVHRQVTYYDRLIGLIAFFAEWYVLRFDQQAADRFQQLRRQRVRIGTMDLKIASIALVHSATLLSGNVRDFQRVPDLQVENWLSV
jgi:tRNA(fMet)-specific endonuclease VapC